MSVSLFVNFFWPSLTKGQIHALCSWSTESWPLEYQEISCIIFLDSKYKWYHMIFISLYLISLNMIISAAAAKSLQSCLTLCNPINGSPPGSAIPEILQARTMEWVAISFSNAWKWKVKVKSLSRVRLLGAPWTAAYQAPLSMRFPGKSTGVGCHCLLRWWSLGPSKCCKWHFIFYGWVIFIYIYIPHLYAFICWWIFRLLPYLGYCK